MAETRNAAGCLAAFALLWCLFTAAFDGVILWQASRQLDAARRFLPTEAEVVRSDVATRRDADGTTYRPDVAFRYEVAGAAYEADTLHFAVWGSSDRSDAEAAIRPFPVGAMTTAWYDPDDPSVAILQPGVKHLPWFLLIFLTPFHCAGVGLWLLLVHKKRFGSDRARLGRMVRRDDGFTATLRKPPKPAWALFLTSLGAGAFGATFVIAFTAGFDASMELSLGVMACLVAAAALFTLGTAIAERLAPAALLDRTGRTLTPASRDRRRAAPDAIAFDAIRSVRVRSTPRLGRGATDGPMIHHVEAVRTRGEPAEILHLPGDKADANLAAAWLRREIGRRTVDDAAV